MWSGGVKSGEQKRAIISASGERAQLIIKNHHSALQQMILVRPRHTHTQLSEKRNIFDSLASSRISIYFPLFCARNFRVW